MRGARTNAIDAGAWERQVGHGIGKLGGEFPGMCTLLYEKSKTRCSRRGVSDLARNLSKLPRVLSHVAAFCRRRTTVDSSTMCEVSNQPIHVGHIFGARSIRARV